MRQKYLNWLSKISQDLAGVPGVIGVVLGGSHARGKGKKDSDFDLGIYYQSKNFDWEKVVIIAKNYDDNHQPKVFGAPGTCGLWINGGIWLTVKKKRVDFYSVIMILCGLLLATAKKEFFPATTSLDILMLFIVISWWAKFILIFFYLISKKSCLKSML